MILCHKLLIMTHQYESYILTSVYCPGKIHFVQLKIHEDFLRLSDTFFLGFNEKFSPRPVNFHSVCKRPTRKHIDANCMTKLFYVLYKILSQCIATVPVQIHQGALLCPLSCSLGGCGACALTTETATLPQKSCHWRRVQPEHDKNVLDENNTKCNYIHLM